jgi:putative glutamine amidotransferase
MSDHSAGRRPLIAIPARYARSASALRFEAEVSARKLVDAVFAAGGEPVTVHPHAPGGRVDVAAAGRRLAFADGVLLPGGGDLSGLWSGRPDDATAYDVDVEQDGFDLAVAHFALQRGVPLLAVCRGVQVVNVARGGTLHADMAAMARTGHGEDEAARHHRHRVHHVTAAPGSLLAGLAGPELEVSCYHHQCLDGLGAGLRPTAFAEDGVVEAVELDGAPGWFLGVQWHPEDSAARLPAQQAVFGGLVDAARHAPRRLPRVSALRSSARSGAGPASAP